jgi:hypothetical protein
MPIDRDPPPVRHVDPGPLVADVEPDHRASCPDLGVWGAELRLEQDPVRFPGAVIHVCERCGARVIEREGHVLDDPDREALELRWQLSEIESEKARSDREAAQVALTEELRAEVAEATSTSQPPEGGTTFKKKGGRPPRDRELYLKRWEDAARRLRARDPYRAPTMPLMAEELGIGLSTAKDWVTDLGLPAPRDAGKD